MKKIAVFLLAVLLSFAVFAHPVSAAENDPVAKGIQVAEDAAKMTFPTDGTEGEGVCPVCQIKVKWIPLDQENFETAGYRLVNGKHYYLTESVEGTNARILAPESGGHVGCIHLNGKNVTSTHSSSTTISGSGGQLNIMGSGELKGAANGGATLGSTIHINTSGKTGSVNLYGGTYSKLNPSGNTNVIAIRDNGGIVNIYAGATVKSGTDASAISISGVAGKTNAVVNIYGGTIDGSTSKEVTVDIRENTGSNAVQCNLYAGTITGGNGVDTPNGGNVYVGKGSSFRMYGGTVTGGEATNGGNIYVDGSFQMYGGTVTSGSATGKGKDILVAANAAGYLLGGNVAGEAVVAANAKCYLGETAFAQNGDSAALHIEGTLCVCDGWSGSATVSFPTEYASGANIPAELAQVVQLKNDLTAEAGGSFDGRLMQMGSKKAALGIKQDGSLYVAGVLLIDADGKQTEAEDPLTQWVQGKYAYIKLCTDAAWDMAGQEIIVDLNGYTLTVNGSGKLQLLDAANDHYDASQCGQLINNGTVTVAQDTQLLGKRYIALTDGNVTTAHRMEIQLTTVTLRTEATGVYYKAQYDCDDVLAELVSQYGVALSVWDMPGANFRTERNETRYTAYNDAFRPGVVATSGSVFNIMGEDKTAQANAERGEMKIYANPYLILGDEIVVIGDTKNPGKTADDAGFDGVAYSLRNTMEAVEVEYYTYTKEQRNLLDAFYTQWKDKGMDWQLVNVGQPAAVSNENLVFTPGTSDAWCDVCKKTVTWIAVTQETHGETGIGTDTANKHYYLAEDILYSGKSNFIRAPGSGSACLHLNGHDLTATAYRAILGYSAVLNVLGEGNVAGTIDTENRGAAVDINTSGKAGTVNLYGGNYQEYENTDAVAVAIHNNGGAVSVYEGATIVGDVYVGTANLINAKLGVYGGNITGTVTYVRAEKEAVNILETSGQAKIKNLILPVRTEVTLQGAPVIQLMELGLGAQIQAKGLAKGASITVRENGVFGDAGEQAEAYTQYFKSYFTTDSIVAEGSKLVNAVDYSYYQSPWEMDVIAQAKADGKIHYYFMSSQKLWIRNSHDNEKWGDSCLIVFPDGKTMLVDSGYQDMGPLIWRNLHRMGVTKLDYLVVSHNHTDHYGGAFGYSFDGVNLVETGFMEHMTVGQVFMHEVNLEDNGYETVVLTCEKYNIPTTVLKNGDAVSLGDVQMEVLWPKMDAVDSKMTNLTNDINDTSLVLRFDYGEHSSLFAGDLYVRGEGWLMGAVDNAKLDVDLLKAPHHGRNTSSSTAFVNAVTPELAVATGRAARGQVDAVYAAVDATFLNEWDRGYIHVTADRNGTMTYETTQ